MKKRILIALFVLLIIAVSAISVSAASASASASSTSLSRGDTFTIAVDVSGMPEAMAGRVDISQVDGFSVTRGKWDIDNSQIANFNKNTWQGVFALDEADAYAISGEVFVVTLKVDDDCSPGEKTFTIEIGVGSSGTNITASAVATVTVNVVCNHSFDSETVDAKYLASEKDCQNYAKYYKSCSSCGEKGTVTFDDVVGGKADHSFTEAKATDAFKAVGASCEKKATYYYSCKCGAKGSETFESGDVLGHTGGTATCTKKAVCTRCQKEYGELAAHVYDKQVADKKYEKTAAGCETVAVYFKSCVCGKAGDTTFNGTATLGHTGGEATCTKKAVCTRCQKEYGDLKAHAYTVEKVEDKYLKDAATCTAAAKYYKSCVCGKAGTDTFTSGTPIAHTYSEKVEKDQYIAGKADCEKKATFYYSCKCGAKGSETFESGDVLGHTGGEATCQKKAVCTRCQKEYGDLKAHVFTEETVADKYLKSGATCTAKAVYYKNCTMCDLKGGENDTFESGAKLPHTFDKKVEADKYIAGKADCEAKATYYFSCKCGEKGESTFEAGEVLGHTGGEATCTKKAVCTRCQKEYGELAAHAYDKQVEDKKYEKTPADCETPAVYFKSCVCGKVGETTFNGSKALGHTGGEATCTKKAVCTRCEKEYGETAPHKFTAEIQTDEYKSNEATCELAKGYYKSCQDCGAKGTAVFYVGEALGHIGGTATCDARAVCTRCEEEYGDTPPHSFTAEKAEAKYLVSAANCENAAVYYKSCVDCGTAGSATFTVGEALGHDYAEAWTSDKDGHKHACKVCDKFSAVEAHVPGAEATEETAQTCTVCAYVITPALGHKHNMNKTDAVAATCTADGMKEYYVCSGCKGIFADAAGEKETTTDALVVKAIGHSASDWIVDKAAEVGVKGEKHKECTICKAVLETAEIDALPEVTETETEPVTETETIKDTTSETETVIETETETDSGTTKAGCASVVGFGSVSIIVLAGAALVVSFKKKED